MRELQQWMTGAIVSPVPPDAHEIAQRLLPSATLDADERLWLYRDMYELRMIESMQIDYPALSALVTEKRFRDLVLAYVERHPSCSYTLNRLGDHFPDTLTGFERDLARLELAMTEVFDEHESPVLEPHAFASVKDVGAARLATIKALRLLQFDYPVNDCFTRYREGLKLRRLRPRRTWLCVHRQDYAVRRMPLAEDEYACLSGLQAGLTVAEAVAPVASDAPVFNWFHKWSEAGLFSEIG